MMAIALAALHNGKIGWDEILVSILILLAVAAIAWWQDRRGASSDT